MIALVVLAVDVWSALLAVGLVATFVTTVSLILGWTPGRRTARRPQPPTTSVPWRVSTADSARERAASIARAKAEAAGRTRGIELTEVRELPAGHAAAAGQDVADRNDPEEPHEGAVSSEEATAIMHHVAEHDPLRIAEVMTQWIRADLQHDARRSL